MFTVMLNYMVLFHHCVTESEHVLGLLPLQCLLIHIKLEAHDIPQGLNIILWEINLGVLYEALCQSIYLHGPYQAASLK